jgi:hypothetical protein
MTDRRVFSAGILLLLASAAACHEHSPTSPSPASVPSGAWGGSQASLTVFEGGGVWRQLCASGTIDHPLTLDAAGRFDSTGRLIRNPGGPIETGGAHPARYSGTTDGKTMTITIITTDDNDTFGPFSLAFGKQTEIGPCPLV